MTQILLVSHGDFCIGLLNSYKMIAGETKKIKTVSLSDEGIGDFSKRLKREVEVNLQTDDLLIFCDIKGGTPFNEAYNHFLNNPERIRIIPGMNLPMLIEIGMQLETNESLDKLYDIALDAGKIAIERIEYEEEAAENNLEF
ncbi:PTS sugar transporter subunit IIA [Tetragenococcus solitarius]|uniref:PTS sugar transporter subunit IIA n=1 Tax=Tetragenococcus solitarius TaxID=71453 RepID=A0ABN3Y5Q4_9ENTE|nr:PTS sugar transporter subunit IIA [Tetragenococcus solitarius]